MDKVNRIYHIADVHCRLVRRYDEYRQVFTNLFSTISEIGVENSVIVIVGDIVHSKTDMSPEMISLVSMLLRGCCELCPTIIIPGNHDLNESNLDRLDAISPIVDSLRLSNLYYMNPREVLTIGNTAFYHDSMLDREYVPFERIDGVNHHIALYHGIVGGASTDSGFSGLDHRRVVDDYSDFDIVLLGDIHKTQFLNYENTIAYCGSLIQQDYTEDLERGMLVWDVCERRATFHRIQNDYGLLSLTISGGEYDAWIPDWLKYANIRLRHADTDRGVLESIKDQLIHRFDDGKVTIRIEDGLTNISTGEGSAVIDIGDTHDSISQLRHIQDYLKTNHMVNQSTLKAIAGIHTEVVSEVDFGDMVDNVHDWEPITFEFSNMFAYGDGNVVDFSNIRGIVGLFAPNASGKSTLLDALTYCIFDKCSLTSKASKIMNNQSNEFQCEFIFRLGGYVYTIRRFATRSSKGAVSVDVEFYRAGSNGQVENLTGRRRDETNKVIREYVGSYDDFVLTTLSSQADNRSFIDLTKKHRQELLYRFLNIDVYAKLYTTVRDKLRIVQQTVDAAERQDHYTKLVDAECEYGQVIESLEFIDNKLSSNREVIRGLQGEYDRLSSQRHAVGDLPTISELQIRHDELQGQIKHVHVDIDSKLDEKVSIVQQRVEVETMIGGVDVDVLEREYADAQAKVIEFNKLDDAITELRMKIRHHQSKVDMLSDHKYDPECKYCIENQFVVDANTSKQLLDELSVTLDVYNVRVGELSGCSDVYDAVVEKRKLLDMLRNRLDTHIRDIAHIDTQIEVLRLKLETLDISVADVLDKLETRRKNDRYIIENSKIDSGLDMIRRDISKQEELRSKYEVERMQLSTSVGYLKKSIELTRLAISEYETTKHKLELYKYYEQAVGRDGVPYTILRGVLPIINNSVNRLLGEIVEFSFELAIDDDRDIDGYIMYRDGQMYSMDLSSGMERFILGMAIRSSLIQLSSLPKPNFLVIDEGFGVLDASNINSIDLFLNALKSSYGFILCISHITSMRDYMDRIINVDKVDGRSRVNV